ncbi:uncharacterized protein G2W53_014070 [Senna tora]|uniref:Uncharacterized protein n=1 Tax=Senna tora TaxID=362788 RepID=A0A834U0C9_9FABA|nr:uncharacterized protein G2W53_014070 [Senna tora]
MDYPSDSVLPIAGMRVAIPYTELGILSIDVQRLHNTYNFQQPW